MEWSPPTFSEIKMDAEIGSYQEDGEPMPFTDREPQGERRAPHEGMAR
jgi:hypothetical protein